MSCRSRPAQFRHPSSRRRHRLGAHPGLVGVRSEPPVATPMSVSPAPRRQGWGGDQCCYDEDGNLLPEGTHGGGTYDDVGPAGGEKPNGTCSWTIPRVVGHFFRDVCPAGLYWACAK